MPVTRRHHSGGLHRVLTTAPLFSTAYGNVGSSIYYALGLVTVYALGLTPIAFFISGAIFFFTAVTYAEATARFPEAGGSSSFTRQAFNEGVSFFAGWAQMLNYTVTIAISAIFVPHYLNKFAPGLHLIGHPNDIIGGAVVVALLALLNVVGIKEAAGLNIFLALADLATQALLVVIGLVVVFSPHILISNVHLGVTPSWSDFVVSIPVAMVAYTGIETVSNMAEEAIDPPRHVPHAIMYVVVAVFAIYAFLPSVALSALPVKPATAQMVQDSRPSSIYQCTRQVHLGEPTSDLACRYAGDPVAGLVATMPSIPATIRTGMEYYVAILAATILIIATNAGIIGVSRLTYSMGQHRQLPEVMRRVHPRFNTPYVAIGLYSVIAVFLMIPNGATTFLGNLYAFGAMLSFTLAHASVIKLRSKLAGEQLPWRGPLSIRTSRYDIPVFAILGGIGTLASWLVTIALHFTDYVAPVGLAWLAIGMVVYVVYRKLQHLPLTETVMAPVARFGPAVEVEYRSILLPIKPGKLADEMTATAFRLAAESGTSVVALYPIQVPLELPASAPMEAETREAERELREAVALGREYGVSVITRIVRTRNVGQAIVDEAARRRSEIIVMGAAQRKRGSERMFGKVVDYVLRNATCRVMVGSVEPSAAGVL
jgi:APA family basic amino acid/polyamine antiporter